MHAFNDLSSSHWGLTYPGRTQWYYTSIWPNRVEHTEGFCSHGAENKGWTKHFQKKKKKKISLKKSEVNWIFTLYSRTKITNNKKQLNALLVLCPHTELQYDCELAEKRAWLFHSDAHLEQYKRLITCVNAVWHLMSLLCWPYARVDGREPSSKEVRLVSKCGNIKNSVRRKHTNENKKWWNQRKESNDNVVPVPKVVCDISRLVMLH